MRKSKYVSRSLWVDGEWKARPRTKEEIAEINNDKRLRFFMVDGKFVSFVNFLRAY